MINHLDVQQDIGVSKLCCPVCWELLQILAPQSLKPGVKSKIPATYFSIRGSHSTVSPTQLPRWLPDDVVKKMVDRFRQLLHSELAIFSAKAAEDPILQLESVADVERMVRTRGLRNSEHLSDDGYSSDSSNGSKQVPIDNNYDFFTTASVDAMDVCEEVDI
jgi:hypothetical protein